MTSIYTWSVTPADNATADSAINWAEFQAPDTVNNSARQLMARVAETIKDLTPTRTSGGTGNAYTVTTSSSIAALVDGTVVYFYADKTSTGAATLAVNSFGAKPLRAKTATSLTSGDIQSGTIVAAYYRLAGDEWIVVNSGFHTNALVPTLLASQLVTLRVGSVLPWPTATIPTGWLECDGSAISRTTYATLYATLGTIYGAGDASTTFNLPDYRGQFLRGHANGQSTDPDRTSRTDRGDGTTGDAVGTKQTDQTESHTHGPGTLAGTTNATGAHTHTLGLPTTGSTGIDTVGAKWNFTSNTLATNTPETSSSGNHDHTVTVSSGVTASTGGNETRPTNVYVKWIILASPPQASAATLGVNGLLYQWDTGTTAADPTSGKMRVNSATLSSATAMYISTTGADAASYGSLINTWDDSTNTVKGTLHWYKVGALSTYAIYTVSGSVTDNSTYRTVTLTHVASAGTFASGDQLAVLFHRAGDAGAAGAAGATGATGSAGAAGPNVGLDYQWNTATSGDPGTGKILVNNATPSSATVLHISDLNRLSASQAAYIATWDDSTTSGNKGVVRVLDTSSPGTNFVEYQITAALTDAGAYVTFPVTYIGGAGTLTNDMQVSGVFFRSGDKGTDGAGAGDVIGPAASIDAEIALYDSTTGKLLKRASTTGIVKATSGVIGAAVSGTDYAPATSGTSILKGNGSGGFSNAAAGTDYMAVVGRAYTEYLTYTTGTTDIPADDTIPQNTEGTELMTASITPKSATNRLRIHAVVQGTVSVTTNLVTALFQDSTANALRANYFTPAGANYHLTSVLLYEMVAGTTSATTFKVRIGCSAAGNTWAVNGNTTNRFMGGVAGCSIVVEELAP